MDEITDINRELMLDANAAAGLLYEIHKQHLADIGRRQRMWDGPWIE